MNLFIPSQLDWKERGLKLRQITKFPNNERITFTFDHASTKPTALKVRVPYWATKGVVVSINGEAQDLTAAPSTYLDIQHPWKSGDVVTIDMPLSLHIAPTPDDKLVEAAMYGPLVLAARLGTEGLTTSMIYGGYGPRGYDDGYPMPEVDMRPRPHRHNSEQPVAPAQPSPEDAVWFEQAEGTPQYPLQFQTRGRGPHHSLVPLNQIMDERYSVYLRNMTTTGEKLTS